MKRMREQALVLLFRFGIATVALLFVVVAVMPNGVVPTNVAGAAGDFSIKTGYYIGNGTTRTVTGVGFAPQVVIIKADTAAGATVWKSSAMPAGVSTYFSAAADNTETQIILESDGFTVNSALEVNTINTRYTYIAFYGSDCTASGVMCVGSYTGTGTASRTVTTGFQPDLVWSKRTTAALGATFRTSSMSTNNAGSLAAVANDTTGVHFQTLDATGFTVGLANNANASVYYYVAFKSLAGKLVVGQFTGDGVDNKEITGVGFEPDFVLVKQNAAVVPAYNITETWGDYSSFTSAAANAANSIQELKADGFQVGNSTSVNTLGIVSNYFAFGGSADPAPSGSFLMQRGSYVGTGVAQTIATPFPPDLVIVKGNATEYAVFSTSVSGGVTHYQGVAAAGILTGIGAMNGNVSSFSVGTHSTVNTNGNTYEYIVFGNATSPHKGAGASDFIVGAHTGNALTPRPIDHLGMDPDMVAATKSYTTGTATAMPWRSVSMAANNNAYFTAVANLADGTAFRTLDADGFTIGSSNDVNTAGATIVWYGFEEGAGFDVGTYTGNGVAGTNITAPGFAPDYVWTKRSTAVRGVHRSSSATITGAFAQHFLNVANTVDYITAFISTGFTLGTQTESNANTGTYFYAAWDATASANAPTTPTNSAPANATTAQDLAATLSASYNDTDGNAQIAAEWQVDDDSSFATPVWTRSGGAETSTSVTSGNGTFANELAGKTELDHNTTYFWRVRYSDGVWSSWSTGTYFTTNAIVTPTHTAPTNASTVTTLTPTLSASAFSDPQSGHTASSSQWLISTTNDFSAPLHDSGAISYGASYAVPAAVLSNQSSYHWSVRYQDSTGQWSEYSTPTRFLVIESPVSVTPLFGNTVVDQGDEVNIDAQVKLTDGTIISGADAVITIFNPSGTKIVDADEIEHVAGSSGIYRYVYIVPDENGSYLYEVTATTTEGRSGTGAANFEVRTISADLATIKTTTQTTLSNMDILIGALIVVQSTVNDASATPTSFVTSLTNSVDDFYTNGTLTFTSGALDGIIRRISDYNGTTKAITLDPALPSAPADGAAFTITSQNLRSQEQLLGVGVQIDGVDTQIDGVSTQVAGVDTHLDGIDTQLDSIESKVDIIDSNLDTVLTTLTGIETNMSTIQTSLNTMRTSQQKNYDIVMSDEDSVSTTGTYRTTVTLRDFESAAVNAYGVPEITIYDAERSIAITDDMTAEGTGVYSFEYDIPPGAIGGTWESRVAINPDGQGDVVLADIWALSGSPAEVVISDISDNEIPSIVAEVTITNEGGSAQEYNYTWCVVDNESDGCDDAPIYTASAAKLLAADESYDVDLEAIVSTAGTYWFKIVVDYVSGTSGASLQFDAVAEGTGGDDDDSGVSSNDASSQRVSLSTLGRDIGDLREMIVSDSAKLSKTIALIGNVDPKSSGFRSLLDIGTDNMESLRDVQDKVTEIRSITTVVRQITEDAGNVKVNSFLEWGSIKFGFLISNPTDTEQTVQFKSFLPEEVRPEHVLDLDGLQIEFDPLAGSYYVYSSIVLAPHGSVVRKVHVEDIWQFDEDEVETLKRQALEMGENLEGTQYEASGMLIANDIETTLGTVLLRQQETLEPQIHILNYRENKLRMASVEQNMIKLRELVTEADASRGVFGRLSGIQIGSTWMIIVAIILGFGMLAAVIFAMWRSQMRLASHLMQNPQPPRDIPPPPSRRPQPTKTSVRKNVYHDRIDAS